MSEQTFEIKTYTPDLEHYGHTMQLYVAVDPETAAAGGWKREPEEHPGYLWRVVREHGEEGVLLPRACDRCRQAFRPDEDVLGYGGSAWHGEQESGGTRWDEAPALVHVACMAFDIASLQRGLTRVLLLRFPQPPPPPRRSRRKGTPPPVPSTEPGVLSAVRRLFKGED